VSCKEWKKERKKPYYISKQKDKYYLGFSQDNVKIKYCPFCGSKLNKNGCTGGDEN
jgi:transcription initiation factor IIE alpha subunit